MDLTSWEFFEESAESAFDRGNLDQAWELFNRAVDKAMKVKASVGAVWALFGSMRTIAFEKVDENLAERTFDAWVTYADKTRAVNADMKLGVLGEYSKFLREVEAFNKAEKVSRRALDVAQKHYPAKSLGLAVQLNNLALVLKKKEEYEEALGLMEKALGLFLELSGAESSNAAVQYHNLGELCFALERLEEAKDYHRKALIINEDGEEKQTTQILESLNALARVCRGLGEYADSLILYERALKIAEQEMGLKSLFWAILADNCAQVFQERGDLKKSLELLEKVHPVYLSEYTELNPTTMDIRDRLEQLKEKLEETP